MNNEYPKYLYHATKGSVRVHSAEEEARMGEGWGEAPPRPNPVSETSTDAPECPRCVAASSENAALRADLEALRTKIADLEIENAALKSPKPEGRSRGRGRAEKSDAQE